MPECIIFSESPVNQMTAKIKISVNIIMIFVIITGIVN